MWESLCQIARFVAAPRRSGGREDGFTVVELLIGAMLLVVIAGAAFTAIEVAARSGTEDRNRTRAHAIAEEDQARMRAMQMSQLVNLNQTRTVTEDNIAYTVVSRSYWVSDATGTSECTGDASADYLSVTSTVTWPSLSGRPPVKLESLITPPGGAVSPDKGALAVSVVDGDAEPMEGVTITGEGLMSFTGVTNENGCVIFAGLPEGNYTVGANALSGLVDQDGKPPINRPTSVIALSTNIVALQLAPPGTVNVGFTSKLTANGPAVTTTGDTVTAYNTGMTQAVRFGTVGQAVSQVEAKPLFPFSSPVSFYAGNCIEHDPSGKAGVPESAIGNATVLPNSAVSATVEMPALHVTVRNGTPSNPGATVANVPLLVRDVSGCTVNGEGPLRQFQTNANGQVDTGLPYGKYAVCALLNGSNFDFLGNVNVQNYAAGTSITLYLQQRNGVPAGQPGDCPEPAVTCILATDEFDGSTLNSKWIRHTRNGGTPTSGNRALSLNSGRLRLPTNDFELDTDSATTGRGPTNFIGQDISTWGSAWEVEVDFTIQHTGGWQHVGLIVWQADNNFFRSTVTNSLTASQRTIFVESTKDVPGGAQNEGTRIQAGGAVNIQVGGSATAHRIGMRYTKTAASNTVQFQYRRFVSGAWTGWTNLGAASAEWNNSGGLNMAPAGAPRLDSPGSRIGIIAGGNFPGTTGNFAFPNGSTPPLAQFEYFRMTC